MAPQGDKGKGKEAEQSKPMGGPAMAKPAAALNSDFEKRVSIIILITKNQDVTSSSSFWQKKDGYRCCPLQKG